MAKKLKESVTQALANDLVDSLNKQFKNHIDKAASLLSDSGIDSDVTDWISTGCDILDLAISNRPNGGYPVGRIIEITGLEASGKSLLAAYALKSTQQKGGLAVYIDTESATSREYLKAIGVNIDTLLYLQLEALEDIFSAIDKIIAKSKESKVKPLVTIIVDSVMGATTLKELSGEWGKDGYATDKAIILSKAMRKLPNTVSRSNVCLIFTNQLRQRLGVSFGDPWTTSGGKGIAFAASVRLRLKSIGQIKTKLNGIDQAVGIKTRCIVQKNRMGPPLRSADYEIYFESGIDNYGSWMTTLKDYKIASSGTYWTFQTEYESSKNMDKDGNPLIVKYDGEITNPNTGEIKTSIGEEGWKCRSKDFAKFMDANEKLKQFYYDFICDRVIMNYKVNEDFGVGDIEIEEEFLSEDG